MSIFIDTGIFVAFANKRDNHNKRAVELIDQIRKGGYGMPYTSDYVLDETITTSLVRSRSVEVAVRAGTLILGSKEKGIPAIPQLVRVDEKVIQEAWNMFRSSRHPKLSFTDHTILSQARAIAGGSIMSFDKDFDGLLDRVF